MAQHDQIVAEGRQEMALAGARFADGNYIHRLLNEGAAAQPFQLQAQGWPERLQLCALKLGFAETAGLSFKFPTANLTFKLGGAGFPRGRVGPFGTGQRMTAGMPVPL